ncbi:sulfurtransferase [Seonamhaeicola marinus]|uniref:Sulfurtransferase n=1 Tax=Seonamhaeicola marinus TaxID=1912246 RepID=A0A5D0I4M2_9FLAO|nr:sulfurtransferase [Seonamhaeicola marinus]TYA78665.1 sulfurtransferase [Seonamhaeicola marinus]
MSTISITTPVVSVKWLNEHLKASNLVVLDGTINKVFNPETLQIPGTRFFDIKKKFSEVTGEFPSTFPSADQFQEEAQNLGLNKDSAIVVYDDKGIYSSARVWWLFKAFGYANVAVLNGGFPEWLNADYKTEPMTQYIGEKGNFQANLMPEYMKFFKDVEEASKEQTHTIIDARSSGRFNCEIAEPRAGLRSGTIPNSINLPFTDLLERGLLKSPEILKNIFSNKIGDKNTAVIFSCGSGITACVLALGAEIAGYENLSVYDGSWTEWGTLVKA